jgi:hypothetical protein
MGPSFEGQEIALQSTEGEKQMNRVKKLPAIAFLLLVWTLLIVFSPTRAQAPPPSTEVASFNGTAQAASIAATPFVSINPVIYQLGGMYRMECYVITTQAATTSSTMPSCAVTYTDADTGSSVGPITVSATSGANAVGTIGAETNYWFHAKPSTAISYTVAGYVSSGATPMQYAVHATLEYVGP